MCSRTSPSLPHLLPAAATWPPPPVPPPAARTAPAAAAQATWPAAPLPAPAAAGSASGRPARLTRPPSGRVSPSGAAPRHPCTTCPSTVPPRPRSGASNLRSSTSSDCRPAATQQLRWPAGTPPGAASSRTPARAAHPAFPTWKPTSLHTKTPWRSRCSASAAPQSLLWPSILDACHPLQPLPSR